MDCHAPGAGGPEGRRRRRIRSRRASPPPTPLARPAEQLAAVEASLAEGGERRPAGRRAGPGGRRAAQRTVGHRFPAAPWTPA
ncbi:MAG: hypothetical protein R3F43_01050 [bacterium]